MCPRYEGKPNRFLRRAQRGAGDALELAGGYLARGARRSSRGGPEAAVTVSFGCCLLSGWPVLSRHEDFQAAMVWVNRLVVWSV
jgi:hypothetical protein